MSTICPRCGAALVPGDRFCGDCGGAVGKAASGTQRAATGAPATPSATSRKPRGKKRKRGAAGRFVGIVGLLAVVGGGAAWYLGFFPDSVPTWDDLRARMGAATEGTEGGEGAEPGESGELGAGVEPGEFGQAVQAGEPARQRQVEAEEEAEPAAMVTETEAIPTEELLPGEVPVRLPTGEDEVILALPGEDPGEESFPIFFVINTEPEGARLFVDGDYRGTTPTLVEFDSVGVFRVRLELEGLDPVVWDFDPREWGYEPGPFEHVVSITIPIGGSFDVPILRGRETR